MRASSTGRGATWSSSRSCSQRLRHRDARRAHETDALVEPSRRVLLAHLEVQCANVTGAQFGGEELERGGTGAAVACVVVDPDLGQERVVTAVLEVVAERDDGV